MRIRIFVALALLMGLSGCSLPVQNYQPSVQNVHELRNTPTNRLGVGAFSAREDEAKINQFSLRGSSLTSPSGSFAAYLENAVKEELKHANKLDLSSEIRLTGVLVKNVVDASGISLGTADIEAEFTVVRKGKEIFRKIKSIHHEWPSSFVGAVALPAAQTNYPIAVQKLLSSLLTDADFITSIQ